MSPSKNMLRFKTENSGPNSPYSPSVLGYDTSLSNEVSTPPKPPRKVPKTPHKVCIHIFFLKFKTLSFYELMTRNNQLD